MEGAATMGREERDTPASWKPPEPAGLWGLVPAAEMLLLP